MRGEYPQKEISERKKEMKEQSTQIKNQQRKKKVMVNEIFYITLDF